MVLVPMVRTLSTYVESVVATVHHVFPKVSRPLDVPWVEVASIPSVQGGIVDNRIQTKHDRVPAAWLLLACVHTTSWYPQ